MSTHQVVPVPDATHVAAARAQARTTAERAGFDETDAHRAGLVATELASNLAKHAGGGHLLLRMTDLGPPAEIELIGIDRGPGIADVAEALVDGYSTAGSSGTGLGGIRRLSDAFDLYSTPGRGTVVWSRLRAGRAAARLPPFDVAGVCVAIEGERVSGDAWTARQRPEGLVALVADGLGHGPGAAEAAAGAVAAFSDAAYGGSTGALETIHDALRHTRGAAGAIALLQRGRGSLTFAGVGNIGATILQDGTTRQAVSHSGILGHQVRHFREYSYPWDPHAVLVMHSDGLRSQWSLDPYPGLRRRRAAVIAAVLYRDFSRGHDDVTVLVVREAA